MASFEDRVRQIVEPDLEDIRNLFLDDQPAFPPKVDYPDLDPLEKKLDDILKWVKNVKSEVRQIYTNVPKKDDPKKEEEEKERTPEEEKDWDIDFDISVQDVRDILHIFYMWMARKAGLDPNVISYLEKKYYQYLDGTDTTGIDFKDIWNMLKNDSKVPETVPALPPPPQEAPEAYQHSTDDIYNEIQFLIKCCHMLRKSIHFEGNPPDVRLPTQMLMLRRYPMQGAFLI